MTEVDIDRIEDELKNITIQEIQSHPTKSRQEIAFEYFQLASSKEQCGQLNDAADYYRKAFKLDEKVDLKYREKFFKNHIPIGNNNFTSSDGKKNTDINRIRVYELLNAYANSEFVPEDEDLPVYISRLPNEVILKIMEITLMTDSVSWINMCMSCKKMSYLGFHENIMWRFLSNEIIFKNQVYSQGVEESRYRMPIKPQWENNYFKMLNERPFLKYRGVYISRVSYMREGGRTEFSNSWNLPFRIITYYRYYRFYPDGRCLKMITILEPKKVVKKLQLDNQTYLHEDDVITGNENWLKVYKGTYKMNLQGDIETNCNGSVKQYRFIDKLKIVNGSKHSRHNKLQWVEMGYYDPVNDVYSLLERENENGFIFSRVRSYYE